VPVRRRGAQALEPAADRLRVGAEVVMGRDALEVPLACFHALILAVLARPDIRANPVTPIRTDYGRELAVRHR
jgi:hypothetical protein